MIMKKVAINGLGRIGRAALKIILNNDGFELVAVNDIAPAEDLVYLLKHDSVYGNLEKELSVGEDELIVGQHHIKVFHQKDPAELPWQELGVEVVFECTGIFRKKEDMEKHLQAGARRVVLSAPSKSSEVATVVHGVNNSDENIISFASCTTNCIAPVAEIMERRIGVLKAVMTTTHAYTSSQSIVDAPKKKQKRGRAAALNIVPTSTGAAKATIKVLPVLDNKFEGIALRVPVPAGSIADMVFVTRHKTSVEEVNSIFKEEAQSERYRGILATSDENLVSSDIIKNPHSSIVDLTMTQVVDGDLVKVLSWYDNEWGYAYQMVQQALK